MIFLFEDCFVYLVDICRVWLNVSRNIDMLTLSRVLWHVHHITYWKSHISVYALVYNFHI